MFYLKEFFGVLWDLKGKGLFFFLMTCLLAAVCVFRPTVQQGILALAPEAWARPYFTVLFDQTVTRQEVLAEISQRPEVAEVQNLNPQETGGVLGRLIAQMGADYQGKAAEIAAFGLRVILKNINGTADGAALLQGLEKSYGIEHVTSSGIRNPRVSRLFQGHPIFHYLKRFGYLGVLLPLLLVWVLSFTMCFSTFSRRAWILERYQRRHFVRAKTTAAGVGFVLLLNLLAAVSLQGPDLMGLVLALGVFSIPWTATMREVQWRSPA